MLFLIGLYVLFSNQGFVVDLVKFAVIGIHFTKVSEGLYWNYPLNLLKLFVWLGSHVLNIGQDRHKLQ